MNSIPLYKQIIEDILSRIHDGSLQPGDRIPSERELAEQYLVSHITSKNALAELADKGYITRQKGKGSFVSPMEQLQMIAEFNSTINHRTILKAKTIGLIMPSMKTSIDQQLLNCIEEELNDTDYILAVTITRENQELESAVIHKLKERGVSGLIIFPTEHEMYNEDILKLNLTDFPFVLIDRYLKGIRCSCVYTDNEEITKTAVRHLLSQGIVQPAFLSPDSHNTVTSDRLSGFKAALEEGGLLLPPEHQCLIPLSVTDPAEKEALLAKYIDSHPEIDGLFCVNREFTKYISRILDRRGWWDRYRITAFDYPDDRRISHVKQDIPLIAQACVTRLIELIQGKKEYGHIVIPASFVPQDTKVPSPAK